MTTTKGGYYGNPNLYVKTSRTDRRRYVKYSLREATGKEVKEYLTDALQAAYDDRLEQIDKRYDYIADTAKTLH